MEQNATVPTLEERTRSLGEAQALLLTSGLASQETKSSEEPDEVIVDPSMIPVESDFTVGTFEGKRYVFCTMY